MSITTFDKGISVIIPCYNAGGYLSEAIESIITHLSSSIYEIIISDDGSDDNGITNNILDIYDGRKGIKILKYIENKGAQFVRNEGLNNAKFPYVFMLDADDKLNNGKNILSNGNYAQRAIKILQNEDIGFVHASTIMFGNFNGYTISPYKLTEELIINKHHVPNYMFYRKEDAIRYGIYNESIKKWQDWSAGVGLLNSRLKLGFKNEIEFINCPYNLYREHSTLNRLSGRSIDEKEMILITIKLFPEIFQKYFPNLNIEEIAEKVFLSKPSKLKDLLFVANLNNLDLARRIIKERGWFLGGDILNLDELIILSLEKGIDYALKIVNDNDIELLTNFDLLNIP